MIRAPDIFPTIGKPRPALFLLFSLCVSVLLAAGCAGGPGGILTVPESAFWKVTASSRRPDSPPVLAADGDESTAWRADEEDAQPWWQADLGRTVHIAGFSLSWGGVPVQAYVIAVSADAVHWSVACEVAEGDGGWDLMAIQPVRARYVRLSVTRRDQDTGVALHEFEVFDHRTAPAVTAGGRPCPQGIALLQATPSDSGWRCPEPAGELSIDFRTERRIGGVQVEWGEGGWAGITDIEISADGETWDRIGHVRSSGRPLNYMGIGQPARWLRLCFRNGSGPANAPAARGFEVRHIAFRGDEGTSSPAHRLQAAAAAAPDGLYPMTLLNRQVYWTSADPAGAALGEEGAFTGAPDQPALWPVVLSGGCLHVPATSGDAVFRLGGRESGPLPEIRWSAGDGLAVRQRAMPLPDGAGAWQLVEVENRSGAPLRGRLCFVLHPVALPPGPPVPVRRIAFSDADAPDAPRTFLVNGEPLYSVLAENASLAVGAATFTDGGDVVRYLDGDRWPPSSTVSDSLGLASGLCGMAFNLPPGAGARALVWTGRVPDGAGSAAFLAFEDAWEEACWDWMNRTRGLDPRIDRMDAMDALRAQTGWLLLPPPADSETIGTVGLRVAALLRAGETAAARRWVRAVASGIGDDGLPPSALLSGRPDPAAPPLAPGEAEGQFAFMLGETARYAGDTAFLTEQYPALRRVLGRLARLRDDERKRRTASAGFFARARRTIPLAAGTDPHEGLLPPDADGLHRYAALLWALTAWREGLSAAGTLGIEEDVAWISSGLAAFRDSLRTSLRTAIDAMPAPGIPEAPERPLPSLRTAMLLSWPCNDPALAEPWEIQSTLDGWYATFLDRFDAASWPASPAAEPLLAIPYARLGRGDYAREILAMRLEHRIPAGWHTWPEAVSSDPRRRGGAGTMPDPRASAAYLLAVRALIADERGDRLDLLRGPPMEWLQYGEGLRVEHMPTPFGTLDLRAFWSKDTFTVTVGGQARPPAGFRVHWPMTGLPDRVTLDGTPVTNYDAVGITLPHDFRGTLSATLPYLAPWPREP